MDTSDATFERLKATVKQEHLYVKATEFVEIKLFY